MNKNDIYWAEIHFQDEDETKVRPALIINESRDSVTVLKITTKGNASDYQFEIIEWEAAGLLKPSYISFEPTIIVPRDKLGDRIGKLQLADRLRFEMRLMERINNR